MTRLSNSTFTFTFSSSSFSFILITLISSFIRKMQRTNPTSPHPSDGQQRPPPAQNNENENQSHDQNQNQVSSLPSHADDRSLGQGQDGGGQEEHSEAPPSSQMVKYGTNLPPKTSVSSAESIFERVISLPPTNSFPPPNHTSQSDRNLHNQSQNQPRYQNQVQQDHDGKAYEIPPFRTRAEQHQHQQSPTRQNQVISCSPTQIQVQAQTPRRNPFANPPPSPSTAQVAFSPLQTPNRPSDPTARLSTDPVATNRLKQNTSAEGTTYSLPAPNAGRQVLVKRASKGINGGFKVPWSAGSPNANANDQSQSNNENKSGEDQGAKEVEGRENGQDQKVPAREISAEQQQISLMLSAQKEAMQKRAKAVQVSSYSSSTSELTIRRD